MQPLVVVSRDIVGVPEIAGIKWVLAGLNESADEVRFGLPLAPGTEVATFRATVILNPLAAELHELASVLAVERVPRLPSAGVGFMLAARMRELNEALVICHGAIPLSRSPPLLASGYCSADLAASVPTEPSLRCGWPCELLRLLRIGGEGEADSPLGGYASPLCVLPISFTGSNPLPSAVSGPRTPQTAGN